MKKLLVAVSILLSGCSGCKDEHVDKIRELENAIEQERGAIKLLRKQDSLLQLQITNLDSIRVQLQNEQQEIIEKYSNTYEKIRRTPDTAQYGITLELLTKHRNTKLERD